MHEANNNFFGFQLSFVFLVLANTIPIDVTSERMNWIDLGVYCKNWCIFCAYTDEQSKRIYLLFLKKQKERTKLWGFKDKMTIWDDDDDKQATCQK